MTTPVPSVGREGVLVSALQIAEARSFAGVLDIFWNRIGTQVYDHSDIQPIQLDVVAAWCSNYLSHAGIMTVSRRWKTAGCDPRASSLTS